MYAARLHAGVCLRVDLSTVLLAKLKCGDVSTVPSNLLRCVPQIQGGVRNTMQSLGMFAVVHHNYDQPLDGVVDCGCKGVG